MVILKGGVHVTAKAWSLQLSLALERLLGSCNCGIKSRRVNHFLAPFSCLPTPVLLSIAGFESIRALQSMQEGWHTSPADSSLINFILMPNQCKLASYGGGVLLHSTPSQRV